MANQGLERSVAADPALAKGINIYRGQVTHETVARDLGYPYKPPEEVIKA